MSSPYPTPRVMFERLLSILNLKESVFVPASKKMWIRDVSTKKVRYVASGEDCEAHMTKGLTLDWQPVYGGYNVKTHSGKGTGEGDMFGSRCGRREFAERVWAIEAAMRVKETLGDGK